MDLEKKLTEFSSRKKTKSSVLSEQQLKIPAKANTYNKRQKNYNDPEQTGLLDDSQRRSPQRATKRVMAGTVQPDLQRNINNRFSEVKVKDRQSQKEIKDDMLLKTQEQTRSIESVRELQQQNNNNQSQMIPAKVKVPPLTSTHDITFISVSKKVRQQESIDAINQKSRTISKGDSSNSSPVLHKAQKYDKELEFVNKMVTSVKKVEVRKHQNIQQSERKRKPRKPLPKVDEFEEEPKVIWVKVSDVEMVSRYGPDSIIYKINSEESDENENDKCKRKCAMNNKDQYKYDVEEVEEIDQLLFERLEREKVARANWRKLYMQIQIVKALSKRESENMRERKVDEDEDEEQVSCWHLTWLDRYVQPPDKLFIVIWNFIALSMNTISIFIVFYEDAFRLTAIENSGAFELVIEFVLFFEMIIFFFKAFPKNEEPRGFICSILGACGLCKKSCIKKEERENKQKQHLERNIMFNTSFKDVAVRYLSSFFITDFLSVVPFLFAKLASPGSDYQALLDRGYMQVFAYLRLLRITQLPKILHASTEYSQILMQKFPSRRQIIFNSKQIFSLILFLLLSLHLSACLNIFQGMSKYGWIEKDENGNIADSTPWHFYISQMYFMTTTMTTIGYGDFNAVNLPDYDGADNMALIFFLQFIAIFTFSLIQDRLFSIVFDVKLNKIVSEALYETEIWLNEMDLVLRRAYENKKKNLPKDAKLPDRRLFDDQVWQDVIASIETTVMYSCYEAFVKHSFYATMPPRLQSKLIEVCLVKIENKFKHFFEGNEQDATRPFINRLLSQMKCSMQRVGSPILNQGQKVDKVYFFFKGEGVLQRQFPSKAYGQTTIDAVILPEGSFFGELPVLLGISCYFTLKAGSEDSSSKKMVREGKEMVLIYELDANVFRDLCQDYPEFSNEIYVRAELRTAYFKYLTSLKQSEYTYMMKIVEIENKIINGLQGSTTTMPVEEKIANRRWKGQLLPPPKEEVPINYEATMEEAREQAKTRTCKLLADLETKIARLYGCNFAKEVSDCIIDRTVMMHEGKRELDPLDFKDQYLILKNTIYHSELIKTHEIDNFDFACQCYLLRRSRRNQLTLHNVQQLQRLLNMRWNMFGQNIKGIIKNEVVIQQQNNAGLKGLVQSQLLQLAQHAFQRKQKFVNNAYTQRERYEINFSNIKNPVTIPATSDRSNRSFMDADKVNDLARVARTAQVLEQLKRHSRLKLDQMSCWARFKYSEVEPALRVHVWDIYDESLLESKTLDSLYKTIYDKLYQVYVDQDFAFSQQEIQYDVISEHGDVSDDSANETLINAIGRCTKTNLLQKQKTVVTTLETFYEDEKPTDAYDKIQEEMDVQLESASSDENSLVNITQDKSPKLQDQKSSEESNVKQITSSHSRKRSTSHEVLSKDKSELVESKDRSLQDFRGSDESNETNIQVSQDPPIILQEMVSFEPVELPDPTGTDDEDEDRLEEEEAQEIFDHKNNYQKFIKPEENYRDKMSIDIVEAFSESRQQKDEFGESLVKQKRGVSKLRGAATNQSVAVTKKQSNTSQGGKVRSKNEGSSRALKSAAQATKPKKQKSFGPKM